MGNYKAGYDLPGCKYDWSTVKHLWGRASDPEIARVLVPRLKFSSRLRLEAVRQVVLGHRRRYNIPPGWLPSRNPAGKLLRRTVHAALSEFTPRRVPHVHQLVLEDYGTISRRQVYRVLRRLRQTGKVIRTEEGWLKKESPRSEGASGGGLTREGRGGTTRPW